MPWDPFREIRRLQAEMDRLFEEFLGGRRFGGRWFLPPGEGREELAVREPIADLVDAGDEIVATVELPGVNKEDIKVNITENQLEISAETRREEEEEGREYYSRERRYHRFYRRMSLPENVKADAARARYRNGVLEVRIPKLEKPRGREVKIE
ncbi:MAG: Hsp20/alpha crystallin family protein [Methanobacteriota archaeon]|nr:MAG: Hsp20/alpha crystallin family protein [Euryarchaeota archaeon]